MDRLPVSVIIPTYNRARLILRSLNSVLAAVEPGAGRKRAKNCALPAAALCFTGYCPPRPVH